MKVVLLAGGLGTRLSEETSLKPNPMVEIFEIAIQYIRNNSRCSMLLIIWEKVKSITPNTFCIKKSGSKEKYI